MDTLDTHRLVLMLACQDPERQRFNPTDLKLSRNIVSLEGRRTKENTIFVEKANIRRDLHEMLVSTHA